MSIKVGDRVCIPGWRWLHREEPDRYGIVVEVYRGIRSASGPGEQLFALKWEDGSVSRGFLAQAHTALK